MTVEYEIGDSILGETEIAEHGARIQHLAPGTDFVGMVVMPDGVMFACFKLPVTGTHRGIDPLVYRGTKNATESRATSPPYPQQYWGATPPGVKTERTFVARSDDGGENWYIIQDLGYTRSVTMDGVQIGYFVTAQILRRKFRVVGEVDHSHTWGEDIPDNGGRPDELVAIAPNPNDLFTGAELEEYWAYNPTMRGVTGTIDPTVPDSSWREEDDLVVPTQEEDGEWYYIVGNQGNYLKGPFYNTNRYQIYDVEDQWVSGEGNIYYDDPKILYNWEDKNQSSIIIGEGSVYPGGSAKIRKVQNLNREDTDQYFMPGLLTLIKPPTVNLDSDGVYTIAGLAMWHEAGTLLIRAHVVFKAKWVSYITSNGDVAHRWETEMWEIPHWRQYGHYDGIRGEGVKWEGVVPVRRPQGLFVHFDTFWTDGVRTGLRFYGDVRTEHFSWIDGGGFAPELTRTNYNPGLAEGSTLELAGSETTTSLGLTDDQYGVVTAVMYIDGLGNANVGVSGSMETKNYGRPGHQRLESIHVAMSPLVPPRGRSRTSIPMDGKKRYPLRTLARGVNGFMQIDDPNVVDGFHRQGEDESVYGLEEREALQERPTSKKTAYW